MITRKIENGKTVYRLNGKTKLYPICKWEDYKLIKDCIVAYDVRHA